MPYFADLTSYATQLESPKRLLVGWIDRDHPFERGDSPAQVIEKIEQMCRTPLRRTRGWHSCPFCREYPITYRLNGGGLLTLGDAEVEVHGSDVVYACPTLILHYMTAHRYKPPVEFLNTLC
jgi:hypothetical protein